MILVVFISKVEFDHAFMVWWNEKQKISNHGFSTFGSTSSQMSTFDFKHFLCNEFPTFFRNAIN